MNSATREDIFDGKKSPEIGMDNVLDVKDIYFDDEDSSGTSANSSLKNPNPTKKSTQNPDNTSLPFNKLKKASKLTDDEIIDMIMARQKRSLSGFIKTLLQAALKSVKAEGEYTYSDYIKALYFILIYRVGGFADYIMTYLRSWQVYSNIMANGTNDPSSNPDGNFNQIMHGGDENLPLTEAGLIGWILCIISFPAGLAIEMLNLHLTFVNESLENHRECLLANGCDEKTRLILEKKKSELEKEKDKEKREKLEKEADQDFENLIRERYQYFLRRQKIVNRNKQEYEYFYTPIQNHENVNQSEKYWSETYANPNAINPELFNGEKYIKDLYRTGGTFKRIFAVLYGKVAVDERNSWFDLAGADYDLDLDDLELGYDENGEQVKRYAIEKFFAGFFNVWNKFWNRLNDDAFAYWWFWFLIQVPKGIAKASMGMILSPIAVSLALATGLVLSIQKVVRWTGQFSKKNDNLEIKNDKKAEQFNTELFRMGREFRYRNAFKTEGEKDKEYINKLLSQRGRAEHAGKDKSARVDPKIQRVLHRTKEQIQNTRLVKKLLRKGDGTARMVFAIIIDAVNAVIMLSFCAWIVSTVAHVFSNFNSVSGFLDGMMADGGIAVGSVGLFAGLVYAVNKYHDMRVQQLDFEARIHKKMCEEYKDGITKLEFFERMVDEVEFKKARTEWLRLKFLFNYVKQNAENYNIEDILSQKFKDSDIYNSLEKNEFKPGLIHRKNHEDKLITNYKDAYRKLREEREALTKELLKEIANEKRQELKDGLGIEFDLEKIDIYNDEYLNNQRHTPTISGYLLFLVSYVHEFFKQLQTGSLFMRTELLVGTTFYFGATALISGFVPIFIPIALAAALAYAIMATTHRYLEECHQNQENFLSNMDANISRIKKKHKHLDWVNEYLDPNQAPKDTSEVLGNVTPEVSLENEISTSNSEEFGIVKLDLTPTIEEEDNNKNKSKNKPKNDNKLNDIRIDIKPQVIPEFKPDMISIPPEVIAPVVPQSISKLPSVGKLGMFKQAPECNIAKQMKNKFEEESGLFKNTAAACA